MKAKDIFFCWDFLVSIIFSAVLFILLPVCIPTSVVCSYYEIGITVLSIVFSIYFASLSILMASPDNDFILFLEEDGSYTLLIDHFRFTLIALFVGLISSIVLYGITSFLKDSVVVQHKIFLSIFTFLFFYGLLCTVGSAGQAIKYAMYRAKFLKAKKQNKEDKNL
jgi:hypothetical protein